MPTLQPAIFRARYHLTETRNVDDCGRRCIDASARRGTNGVFLKAPDVAEVRPRSTRLVARRHSRW